MGGVLMEKGWWRFVGWVAVCEIIPCFFTITMEASMVVWMVGPI